MSQKYYETREFKEKQRKYYAVLKVGGFKDTETLKDIRTNNVNKQVIKVNFDHVRHFEKCTMFLSLGTLEDKFDLFVFELYCEGKSSPEIHLIYQNKFPMRPITRQAISKRLLNILVKAEIEPITFSF